MYMQCYTRNHTHTILDVSVSYIDIGRTDREQIRSRINNNDCRTFRPRRPLSTAYRTKELQCEIGYIANTGQWCCVMLSGCINNQ